MGGFVSFPASGVPWEALRAEMEAAKAADVAWRRGRSPAYVHFGGEDVLAVSKAAFDLFFTENALGRQAFPSLARFEREIVGMSLDLLGGPAGGAGSVTTGGTESIFLVVKAARDRLRRERPDVDVPEIVAARSAHPAFDKAAHCLGVRVVRTPTRDLLADPDAIGRAVGPRTALIVGSAPAYPFGLVDPIPDLAALALERGAWLHVDACVGGFFAPFARRLGAAIPAFDFSLPGVRSISADLHKYGYAAKGASVILYRNPADLEQQGFSFGDWPAGRYATPGLAGTRPGGSIASAWAVMRYLGAEGYTRIAERVLATRRAIQRGAEALGCPAYGDPQLSILAYATPGLDTPAVASGLTRRGWLVGQTREPPGIQLMLNLTHEPVVAEYIADLEEALAEARAGTTEGGPAAVYA